MITEADLQAGLKAYNVTLREGDAVFLHTGWGDLSSNSPRRTPRTTRPNQASASRPRRGLWTRRSFSLVLTPGRSR